MHSYSLHVPRTRVRKVQKVLAESLDLQDGDQNAVEHAAVDYHRFIRQLSAIYLKKFIRRNYFVAEVCGLG